MYRADAQLASAKAATHIADHSSPGTYKVDMDSHAEQAQQVEVTPAYRLAALGGELMGDDRGEWGGELMFRNRRGQVRQILGGNVHGIFQMPFGIVVFTGLAHLASDSGQTYLVDEHHAES